MKSEVHNQPTNPKLYRKMKLTQQQLTEGITVLSLFDGMSCGQLALQRAGIKVKAYYAAEIDKHAIKVTQHNFHGTIHLGDVTKVTAAALPKIDLLIGGSPYQGFSFAGKGLNFEDPRSKLFFEYVRLLKECNPTWFLLENVRMEYAHELVISQYLGTSPVKINSSLFCAQSRLRLYWTNINQITYGLFNDLATYIPLPPDKGILLKHILQTDVPKKYFFSEKMMNYLTTRSANFNAGKINYKYEEDKASCINASSGHLDISDNIIVHNTQPRSGDPKKGGTCPLSRTDGKTYCLDTGKTNVVEIVALRGRNPQNPTSRKSGEHLEQTLEPRTDGKTNTITTVQKDNLVFTQNYLQYDVSGKGYKSQQDRAFYEDGKHGTLSTARADTKTGVLLNSDTGINIRRLTPVECERLQTVPDNYTACVSDTQRYRMLGNGWTVDVVAYIFSFILNPTKP
jgi:DNA (cytosine-5)-methyltransferase 3A